MGFLNNSILFNYIQTAYEHVSRFSQESVQGAPFEIVSRLYRRRVESILSDIYLDDPWSPRSQAELHEWFRSEQSKRASEIILGKIDDFRIAGDFPEEFLIELEQYQKQFEFDLSEQGRVSSLGVDAYATYLPIHFFFNNDYRNSFDIDWGIYIAEDGVSKIAAKLRDSLFGINKGKEPEKDRLCFDIAYQILLRHELVHFRIEAFALNAELILNKPLYVPYVAQVYTNKYGTDDCLEEALANASVLDSVVINKLFKQLIGEKCNWWDRLIAEMFFDHQPPGYSNYALQIGDFPTWDRIYASKWLGSNRSRNPRRQLAMNALCNQIVQSGKKTDKADIPFFAFFPDNYFLRSENLVPIHIVQSLTAEDSFIIQSPPKKKVWEDFLRKLGYYPTGRGKGDHVVWEHHSRKLPDLTINYKRGELDFNAFISSLRSLGMKRKEFFKYTETDRIPDALRQ